MNARTLTEIASGIHPETLAELRDVALDPTRPLIVLDCDEVLVEFAAHLSRWLGARGIDLRLKRYQLEGAMFRRGESVPIAYEACIDLIGRFFAQETMHQALLPGAREAVDALDRIGQIVVLTNVPRHARPERIANLMGHGLDLPVVVNSGGKGRAIAWLERHLVAPVVFIDDSHEQLRSAAKYAPDVRLVYFRGADYIRAIMPGSPEAHAIADDWPTAVDAIAKLAGQTR